MYSCIATVVCIATMHMYVNTSKYIINLTLLAQTSNVETSYRLKDWLLFSKQVTGFYQAVSGWWNSFGPLKTDLP